MHPYFFDILIIYFGVKCIKNGKYCQNKTEKVRHTAIIQGDLSKIK